MAITIWVKLGIDAWTAAADIKAGRLLRPIRKSGTIEGDVLSDWAVWWVGEQAAKEIGIGQSGAHDLRQTRAKLCCEAGETSNRSSFCSGIRRYRRPRGISVRSRSFKAPSTTI